MHALDWKKCMEMKELMLGNMCMRSFGMNESKEKEQMHALHWNQCMNLTRKDGCI